MRKFNDEQSKTLTEMAQAIHGRFDSSPPPCPDLATMARLINDLLPQYKAVVQAVDISPPERVTGTRHHLSQRLYAGNELVVTGRKSGDRVLAHNAAEPQRHNTEVARWVFEQLRMDYQDFLGS